LIASQTLSAEHERLSSYSFLFWLWSTREYQQDLVVQGRQCTLQYYDR